MKKIRLFYLFALLLVVVASKQVQSRPQVISLNHPSGLNSLPASISDADGLLFTYPFIITESSAPTLLALVSGTNTLNAQIEHYKYGASKALRPNAKTYLKNLNNIFLSLNTFSICYPFHNFW